MSRPRGLSEAEYEAVRALQQGEPVPAANSPFWQHLEAISLVWIDRRGGSPNVRLTPEGRAYHAG